MKRVILSVIFFVFLTLLSVSPVSAQTSAPLYGVFETQVTNTNTYTNPFDFNEIELQATFTAPSGKQTNFFGFFDGDGNGGQNGNVWKLRFMPDEVGTWSYTYSWTGTSPNKPAGTFGPFTFTVNDTGLPGPLKTTADNPWYFEDARGNPFDARGYSLHQYLEGKYGRGIYSTSAVDDLIDKINVKTADRDYNLLMVMWPVFTNNAQNHFWQQ